MKNQKNKYINYNRLMKYLFLRAEHYKKNNIRKDKMNKETYEALKIVVDMAYESGIQLGNTYLSDALKQVENWIEEVAKEYEK